MTRNWKEPRVNLAFNISAWSVLQSSQVAHLFWGEIIVCVLHAPPFPWIDDKVGLLMLLRFYMIFHVIRDHSVIYKNRNSIMRKYSKYGIKHWGPPKFSWALSAKALLYRHPFSFLLLWTLWTLWACGHCIYIFEREPDPELFTYIGSLYLSVISMITGWPTDTYDVFYPATLWGRTACIMSTLIGLFLMSLLLEVLSSFVVPTPHQRPALIWTHRYDIKEQLRDCAARIIQLVWKRRAIALRKRMSFKADRRCTGYYRQPIGVRYMQAVKDFRNLMRQKIALQASGFSDQVGPKTTDCMSDPPDEPPPTIYSDEEYSYAQETAETGHGEVEERLKAMEVLIQSLMGKIDSLVVNSNNINNINNINNKNINGDLKATEPAGGVVVI